MAYTINRSSGAVLTTVADGTIDNTADLTLIGKNYSGYGEIINENFVRLLENFSSTAQPSSPLSGQIWWDSANNLLKVYDGTTFKVVSGSTASATQPTGATAGELWFNTSVGQLYVYTGTTWTLIGPGFTSLTGTSGALVETIADNLGGNHVIVRFFVGNLTVAIASKDATFTPQSAIPGFATIAPGIQLSTGVSGAQFVGTATNAQLLDNIDSTQFLRSDTNDTTTGIITVANDGGVTIGADNDLRLTVSGANVLVSNATSNGDILMRVNRSVGGVTTAMTVDGATGFITVTNPTAGDDSAKIATTAWVNDSTFLLNGSNTISGDVLPTSNNVYNLGSNTFKWQNVYATTLNGTAIEALYADLAERFAADQPYAPGTVVALGGAAEITAVAEELSEEVFGVVSGRAAYLMNSGAGDNNTHPAVAMTGRVPVQVIGKVRKGNRLVSAGNGLARAAEPGEANSFNTIGRALENKTTVEIGTVLAVVKIN